MDVLSGMGFEMADNFLTPFVDSIVAIGTAIGLYMMNGHRKRMERIETHQQEDHDDLAQFKLDAANTYAKEDALKRIYLLIDEQGKDIKQILQKI